MMMCNQCQKVIRHLNLKEVTINDLENAVGKCPAEEKLEKLANAVTDESRNKNKQS